MSWAPVGLRWPAEATRWLDDLGPAKLLAGEELRSTALRLADLDGLAETAPGPVAAAARAAIEAGREALAAQMNDAPACLVVTPFQSGVGQGRGSQRFLSAPNLLMHLADKLLEASAPRSPDHQHGLALMFLGSHYDQLASILARFTALMPVPALVQCQRRAEQLAKLEQEKWELPSAASSLAWGRLPLERCTLTKAARQSLSGQLAVLEGYIAESSPMADLAAMAARKAAQSGSRDQLLQQLKDQLADAGTEYSMTARLIGPGTNAELRRQLLADTAPGHEWVVCAGLLLIGPEMGLRFVRELVGL